MAKVRINAKNWKLLWLLLVPERNHMKDKIEIYTAEKSARIYIAKTKTLVNNAYMQHKTTPVATIAFGRTLTAAVIMGSMLKNNKDSLTIQIKGSGPIGGIVATTNKYAEVKGYVFNRIVNIGSAINGRLDVVTTVGKGTLTVTKDLSLKMPVSSQVPIISGEISEDFVHFFAKSEQITTYVDLGVEVNKDKTVKEAGGYIIQLMPNASRQFRRFLEQSLAELPPVTTMLGQKRKLLNAIFGDKKVTYHDKIIPKFTCDCGIGKAKQILVAIGKDELISMLEDDEHIDIFCQYCNTNYHFDESDVWELLYKM